MANILASVKRPYGQKIRASKMTQLERHNVPVFFLRFDHSLTRALWGRPALGTDTLGNTPRTHGDRSLLAKPAWTHRSPAVSPTFRSRTRIRRLGGAARRRRGPGCAGGSPARDLNPGRTRAVELRAILG